MDTKELMRGNLVYWNIPEKVGVLHRVVLIKEYTINTIPIALCNSVKDYSPIPITPERLTQCGFRYDRDMPNWLVRKGLRCNIDNMEFSYMSAKLKKPLYIHQIQNLYFTLNQEELISDEQFNNFIFI